MTPTEQAARVLEGVPRRYDFDPQYDYLREDHTLAAIARHLAPWDDLAAQAKAALEAPDAGVVAELVEALRLADAAMSGANMNMAVVEKKVKAAIAKLTPALPGRNTTEG